MLGLPRLDRRAHRHLAPLLLGTSADKATQAQVHRVAIQCGEPDLAQLAHYRVAVA